MDGSTKININVILCANSDEKVTKIENIFNVLKRQTDDKLTFDIVTVINAFGGNGSKEAFTLVYAFVKHENNNNSQINIVDVESYEIKNEVDDITLKEFNTNMNRGQIYSRKHIDNMYFPGAGQYELQIYKFNDEVDQGVLDKIRTTDTYDDNVECVVNFEIVEE